GRRAGHRIPGPHPECGRLVGRAQLYGCRLPARLLSALSRLPPVFPGLGGVALSQPDAQQYQASRLGLVTEFGSVAQQIGIVVGIAAEVKSAHRLSANILCSGGRPDVAANQAHALIQTGATTLMSFGIAGGLSSRLRPGSLVVADEVIT